MANSVTDVAFLLIEQCLVEVAPMVPHDGIGTPVLSNIVLAGQHGDADDSNAAQTPAALQAAVAALILSLQTKYPTPTICSIGAMCIANGYNSAAAQAADTAVDARCIAVLRPIRSRVPFITMINAGLIIGTGYVGNLKATGTATSEATPTGCTHRPKGTLTSAPTLPNSSLPSRTRADQFEGRYFSKIG